MPRPARPCAASFPTASLAAALALVCSAAQASASLEDALAPPSGAEITHVETRAFDAYPVPVRPVAEGPPTEEAQGRVRKVAFRLEPAAAPAAVTAFYADRLGPLGFDIVLDCADIACGGFAFRRALRVLPQPLMAVGLGDFRQLTLRRGEDAASVSVLASRLGAATHVQVVSVEGAPSPLGAGEAPAIADEAAPAAPAAPSRSVDAGALGARLDAEGRVVLEGVAFEIGATRLAPESDAALDAAAALFAARPDLSAVVVGHTDADGDLALNRRISAQRAEAVVAALVARGVSRSRLSADGVAFLAPRAANATEAGRAANRRVELVAR
ncbi:MAG: OmpA family protein [Rhodobacteraceae bacterium]|nr:MAG: OmpA family protein [Paracoccaceae bacterium]